MNAKHDNPFDGGRLGCLDMFCSLTLWRLDEAPLRVTYG
jgi:hypothetical protein